MVHKRRCPHLLGPNAGPVEPGVLDPGEILVCTSRGSYITDKNFLFSLRSPLTRDRNGSWALNRDAQFTPLHNSATPGTAVED